MENKVADFSLGRYATDSGPQCTKKCCAAGETLWIYLVRWPYDNAIGQCGSCHDVVNFALHLGDAVKLSMGDEITIAMIKEAHERFAERAADDAAFHKLEQRKLHFGKES